MPDNHLLISTEKKTYGAVAHFWSYSMMIIEKKNDDFYVYLDSEEDIPVGTKYTGDKANLFPCYFDGGKKYYLGVLSDKFEYSLITSFNNKTYTIPLYGDNILQKLNWIGKQSTKKSFYLSIGDCNLSNENSKKHTEIKNQLDSYLKELRNKKFENIILDLRGNNGGTENNVLPVLFAIDSTKNKKQESDFTEKIRFLRNGEKSYFSTPINEAYYEYYKSNPGIKIDDLNNFKGNKESKRFSVANFPDNGYKTNFKGKIIILMNTRTASAAEQIILDAYLFNNIILLGTNTMGALDYESLLSYKLPKSNLEIHLPADSNKEVIALQNNTKWHGDQYGFYPDYWCTSFDLLSTIIELTGDEELETVLSDLENNLL